MFFLMNDYFGLILSAGKGSRMRPFSPKEMLPYVNKSILVHGIESLKKLDISHVNIVVGEGKYNVQEHIGNGRHFGVKVSYDFQHVLDGDAGGIRCANTTKYSNAGNVFILFADTVYSEQADLAALKSQFERFCNDPDYVGAIGFKQYPAVIPKDSKVFPYGVALINDELIQRLYEKPGPELLKEFTSDGKAVSIAPAYVFKKDALFQMIKDLYDEGVSGEYRLADAIRLAMSKGKKFSGYVIKGQALDMGRPLPYLTALRDWFVNASDEDIEAAADEWEELALKFKNGD